MEYIKIGKIVNTHGIKGEIRLLSDFEYKEQVFVPEFHIYIGKEKREEVIASYRVHKMFDMLTLHGIHNINDVLPYKGQEVFIKKEDLKIDGYLTEDLLGLEAIQKNKKIGIVTDIMKNHQKGILVITSQNKKHLVPNLDEFIEKIDLKKKQITIKYIEGLIDED